MDRYEPGGRGCPGGAFSRAWRGVGRSLPPSGLSWYERLITESVRSDLAAELRADPRHQGGKEPASMRSTELRQSSRPTSERSSARRGTRSFPQCARSGSHVACRHGSPNARRREAPLHVPALVRTPPVCAPDGRARNASPALARLSPMSAERLTMGASADVPHVRVSRLLRHLSGPSCGSTLPGNGASHHAIGRAG